MLTRATRLAIRDYVAGVAMLSILLSPIAGCPRGGDLGGGLLGGGNGGNVSKTSSGFFINDDATGKLLAAARGKDGEQFFAFGTRDGDGKADISSFVAVDGDGSRSFISFESGRPVHAQGADGSYAHVTYSDVTATRLKGTVDFYDAASKSMQSYPFDIDLLQSAQDIAAQVRSVTGRSLDTSDVPESNAKLAKDLSEAQVRITIFNPLYVGVFLPCVLAVTVMTVVLGQILVLLYDVVVATIQATVIVAFLPLFIVAHVLAGTVVNVRVGGIPVVFDDIPTPPVILLVSHKRRSSFA